MISNAEIYDRVREEAARYLPAAIVTIVEGKRAGAKLAVLHGEIIGSLGSEGLDAYAKDRVQQLLREERSETVSAPDDPGTRIFFDVYPPLPTLLIFGAVHAAQPLSMLAKMLGYRVIVTDARAKLATEERFPNADRVLVAWPDDSLQQVTILHNTYIAILTHDPKFDEPALIGALETEAPYIGAVGSRKTNRDRRERLMNAGVSEESLGRVRGPIGLDIGANTPEEMALSIMAEIVAVRHGREGGPLTAAIGAIRGAVVTT